MKGYAIHERCEPSKEEVTVQAKQEVSKLVPSKSLPLSYGLAVATMNES